MKRRHFSAGLAAGSVLAGASVSTSTIASTPVALPHLHKQAFEARLEQPFLVRGITDKSQFQMHLKAVDTAGKGEQFFVRFSTWQPAEFAEDIYLLTAHDGQEMLLHLLPSASDKHTLEAVINLHTG